jgi:DNA gyrase subunit A
LEQNNDNQITPVDIEKEVRQSFLEYSMSVIVSRAIPDVRDGLKPVHRRILYALHDQGMTHDQPHKKSANIVGVVMARYHPHGDAAIYQTIVKMVQPFALRYPLVDGHGNFGSIDGDEAAAMRYTESRMSRIAGEMLVDIDKETVDWNPNYDDSLQEPAVLPARIPNLLINGSTGIAVGMATNMPPHNLGEVIDAIRLVIDDPEVTVAELMTVLPGPDFPTAAFMIRDGIAKAYESGRGSVRMRARYHVEEKKNGKRMLVVTELPYQVNKARLVEKIADLVKEKRVEGITALRDESDRKGIRVVMEIRNDVNEQILVNRLYKYTQMQESYGIINLALVDGQPKILGLKSLINCYVAHRKLILERRTRHELKVAGDRRHILEGLKIVLAHVDEVVRIIRQSSDRADARAKLVERYELSEIQANAILDMRLVQLTNLEQDKIENEYQEILRRIADLEDILAHPERLLTMIKDDLAEIKAKYADKRRTEIIADTEAYEEEDLIEEQDVVITLSDRGYIKRQPLDTYHAQKRGGKGVSSATNRTEDFTKDVLVTTVKSHVLFFTNKGRVFSLKAFMLPEFSRQAKGVSLVNLLELHDAEVVTAIVDLTGFDDSHTLMMLTQKGVGKKVSLDNFAHIRKNGLIAINLREDDELIGVVKVKDGDKVMLATAYGQGIMFDVEQVRTMGRTASGVRAMRLDKDDYVIGVDKARANAEAVLVTKNGYGKRTDLTLFKTQNRGGKGLKTIDINNKNGLVVGFKVVAPGEEIVILTSSGNIIRLEIGDISTQKRYSRGVMLMKTAEKDEVTAVASFKIDEEKTLF